MNDRNEAITTIREALKRRSGKAWSVKGGRGTAWGWITIIAPPRRRTANWDGDGPGHYMTQADREELTRLLDLPQPVHFQGESIPSGSDYRAEYIDRAQGRTPTRYGKQYWD